MFNIGIHFFDMLELIFGEMMEHITTEKSEVKALGEMTLKKAKVNWSLSIEKGIEKRRSLIVDDEEVNFTDGFEELNERWYERLVKIHLL